MNMEELKKIIQAIVISNAGCPMTILQLDRDFKCHEGYNIPYEKYGFQQLDAMLRSMSDAVQTKGQGSSALVFPVITAKSKHIREMVVKHKKNGKKRHTELSGCTVKKGKFEPAERPRANARDDVVISTAKQNVQIRSGNKSNNVVDNSCFTMAELKKLIQAMVISKPGSPLTVAQLAIDFKHHEGTNIPYREYGFQQLDALLRSIPDVVKLDGQGSTALVYPVTSEKSKHINVMIKSQKNNGKKCYNRMVFSSRPIRHSSKRSSNLNRYSSNEYGNGYCSYSANSDQSTNPNYATYGFNGKRNLRYGNNVLGHSYAPNVYASNVHNAIIIHNHNTDRNLGNDYNDRGNVYASNSYNKNTNPRHDCNVPGQSYASNGYATNGHNANRKRGSHDSVPDNCYSTKDFNAKSNPGKDSNILGESGARNCCSVASSQNLENGKTVPFFSPDLITYPERRFLKLLYEVLVQKRLEKESSVP